MYAVGDAAGGPLFLTPVAALEAHAVVDSLLRNQEATVDYTGIPSVAFTPPPLARVDEPCYAYKILVKKGRQSTLGAHLVGPEAAEVINLFGFAMRNGLGVDATRHATFPAHCGVGLCFLQQQVVPRLMEGFHHANGLDFILIDTLPANAFAKMHLPGAINIVSDDIMEEAPRRLPDRQATLVLYCASDNCKRAGRAAKRLVSLGYTEVYHYTGGKKAWQAAGLSLEH